MTRKIEQRFSEICETMEYFSKVAKKPVWFTYDQLWDITAKSIGYRMTSNSGFPSRHQFGGLASKSQSISVKRSRVKIFHDLPKSSENTRLEVRYAFIIPPMNDAEGVEYGGVQ